MHRERNARLITTGNLEDDLELARRTATGSSRRWSRTWTSSRRSTSKLDAVRKPGSIVSSNTSTIPLAHLIKGMPDGFRRDFLITHFFNPPRYMRLLEIVAGPETRPDAIAEIARVLRRRARQGRRALQGHARASSPTASASIGCRSAINEAIDLGLTVEEADAVIGRPIRHAEDRHLRAARSRRPRPDAACRRQHERTLPADDPFTPDDPRFAADPEDDRRRLYRPQGQGRLLPPESRGRRQGQGGDRPQDRRLPPRAEARLPRARGCGDAICALCSRHPGKVGQYAWRVLGQTLAYAAALVPEIADDIVAVDEAMHLGYTWKFGPVRADRPDRRDMASPPGWHSDGHAGAAAAAQGGGTSPSTAPQDGRLAVSRPSTAPITTGQRARRACCCSPTSSARRKPLAKNGSASAVGHRRRRRLLRIHTAR